MNERVEIAWHTKDIQERLCNPFFHMKIIKKVKVRKRKINASITQKCTDQHLLVKQNKTKTLGRDLA